jgi:chromosome segregation ATPase
MCKKLGVTALVIVAAFFVLHKLDLDSYLKLAWTKTKADVKNSIPPEVKIERLRDEIAKLTPDMRKHRSVIASEMVEVKRLGDQITEAKANLDKREVAIKEMREELKKNTTFVSLEGKKIPREKVEQTLARQWDAYKHAKEAVASQEDLLKAREEALEAAKQKLEAMEAKKKEMEAKVEHLDLELRKLRVAQTKHDIPVDDSQLSTVLKLYDEVDKQIQKEKTELELEKGAITDNVVEEAMARKAKADQALKEMDAHFDGAKITKKD